MKKVIFAISLSLLTSTCIHASSSPKALALEEKVKRLESQLQKAVEELNTQLATEAEKETPQTATNSLQEPCPPPIQVVDNVSKRLEAIETRLTALEKSKQDPLQGARTPEEAKATKEANEKAPKLLDTPGLAQYELAYALLKNNEYDKAKEAFEQFLKDYPLDAYAAKAQFHLGDIFKQLGDLTQAETNYQKALTHKLEEPVMVECRLGLAETLVSLNKTKPACEQVTILQKEQLDEKQKSRLQEVSKKASCQKNAAPK